jgi:hypothetical protein
MSNIDEKAKNNFTIEMRIFENYEKVKYEIIKVIDFLRHAETNLGMCRIFDNQNHELWHSVIKPWFKPERFGITHLWFLSGFSYIGYGEYHIIRGNRWLKTPIDKIDKEYRIFGYWFPTYKKYIPYRIRILKLALKDLERIKEEYVRVDILRDDDHKRILKCQEGKNIWYRLWINPEDMMRIEPLLEGGDRIWMEELGMYYTFFYEIRNGRRIIGKNRVKKILDTLL